MGHFGVNSTIFGRFEGHILASFWDHFGMIWHHFGRLFGVVLTASWVIFVHFMGHFVMALGRFLPITETQSFRHRAHSGGGLFLAQS